MRQISAPKQQGRRTESLWRLKPYLGFSRGSIRHGSLKHTFIAFSWKRTKKSGGCGREGGPAEVEVSRRGHFNHWSIFLQPDTAVFPQWRTLACPLEWKGNVNIQESIFGRVWGVSLEVVGEEGGGAAIRNQRQNVGGVWGPMWEQDAPEG